MSLNPTAWSGHDGLLDNVVASGRQRLEGLSTIWLTDTGLSLLAVPEQAAQPGEYQMGNVRK